MSDTSDKERTQSDRLVELHGILLAAQPIDTEALQDCLLAVLEELIDIAEKLEAEE